jgi:hypothetical protein
LVLLMVLAIFGIPLHSLWYPHKWLQIPYV